MTRDHDKDLPDEHRKSITTRSDSPSNLPSSNLIDQALQELTDEQKKELARKASEMALELHGRQVRITIDDDAARRQTQDHVDTFNLLDKKERLTRHTVVTDVKTGAGTRRIESRSGPTCFVASASFGDTNAPTVRFFRRYRDSVLITKPAGRRFIAWYYRTGPRLAVLVERHRLIRGLARPLLLATAVICEIHLVLESRIRAVRARR